MTKKGIPEILLFDPTSTKMDCPFFEVTTVMKKKYFDFRIKILLYNAVYRARKKSVN